MRDKTHYIITLTSKMAKKKTKGKRKIVVQKRARKKRKTKAKRRRGVGVFGNQFPTNRQVDSNQYWQLRAEIAGAEGRVLRPTSTRLASTHEHQHHSSSRTYELSRG